MDNASKALIMAGAILISVAIVGIGIYIFSVANGITNDAVNSMESTQVQMFNNQFYRYANDDDKIQGTRARELYQHAKSVGITPTGNTSFEDRRQYLIEYEYDTATAYINAVKITQQ